MLFPTNLLFKKKSTSFQNCLNIEKVQTSFWSFVSIYLSFFIKNDLSNTLRKLVPLKTNNNVKIPKKQRNQVEIKILVKRSNIFQVVVYYLFLLQKLILSSFLLFYCRFQIIILFKHLRSSHLFCYLWGWAQHIACGWRFLEINQTVVSNFFLWVCTGETRWDIAISVLDCVKWLIAFVSLWFLATLAFFQTAVS